MLGGKSFLGALALSAWFGSAAEAQGVVPGGWAPQFGYQSFAAPGAVGGGGYLGFGYGVPMNGFAAPGPGGFAPYGASPVSPVPGYTPSSRAVNGINPLIGSIRRSTSRKGR
jgi:hypothetical protein